MKTTVLMAGIIGAIVIGGIVIYYGSSPGGASPGTLISSAISSVASTTTGPNTSCNASTAQTGCSTAPNVPKSEWGTYLGFIPQGYTIQSKALAAFVFPCPPGMTQLQCQTFTQTCGNGVCDPNETCSSCPVDCSVPGDMSCDPYTGRAGAPATLCQIGIAAMAAGQGPEGG